MAQKTSKATKNPGGEDCSCIEKPFVKQDRQSSEKRLSAIFDALTEEILTTLEHNYETKER